MNSLIGKMAAVIAGVFVFLGYVALADLPSGYTQLEWIESDGRQWIDTGVQARSGLNVIADMKLLSTDPKQALFGGSNYGGSSAATYGTNQLAIVTRNASEAWGIFRLYYKKAYSSNHTKQITGINNLSKNINERATWQINDGVFYFNGTKIDGATGQTFNTGSTGLSGNIYICWMGIIGGTGASSVNRTAAMLYGFTIQVKSNSTYLRKFVPARRDSDGAVGMFDTVESVFYQSPGDVPFRAGPTVSKVFSFDTPAASVGYRSEMTVSGYTGGETALSGFPVLVRVSPSAIRGFSYAGCLQNGADVYFATDADGQNRLACDIENWDASGESLVWVKLPEVSGTDTKFYMFWGSGEAEPRPPAKEVWSEYVAVWHMNSCDPVTGVPDETGHGYNATNAYASASSPNVSTVIDSPFGGSALNLSYGLIAPNYDEFMRLLVNQMPESSTISCWFKKCGSVPVGAWDTVIYKWGSTYSSDGASATSGTYRWGYVMELCGTTSPETDFASYFAAGKDGSATTQKSYNHDNFVDNWTQVAMVSQGATVKSYVNGTNTVSTTVTAIANAFGRSSKPLRFGCAARPIDIEETRIVRVPRSAKWMKAEYDSMNNENFVVAGSAEALQCAVSISGVPAQYAANVISYGTDADVSIGTPKTYTAPAIYGIDATNRAVCAGWELYSTDPTEGLVLARTSETPLPGEDATTCIVSPTGNDALTWIWTEERFIDAAASVEGQGTVLGGGWCTNDVDIALTAVPAEGYYFLCWSGATDGVEDIYSTNITVSVDMPKVLRAEFRPTTDCVFDCSESGTVNFFDPANWLNGNVPASDGTAVVVMRRPPEGVSVKVTAATALDIATLDMGYGSGAGSLTLELGCGLATNRVAGDVILREGATLTHACHDVSDEAKAYALNLEVGGDVTIEYGASIDVSAKGFAALKGPLAPAEATSAMGGGHGGTGQGGIAAASYAVSADSCYGSIRRPDQPGSGCGNGDASGFGGGVVHIVATNGVVEVEGGIFANGGESEYSSAAGGSIWIECGALEGAGAIHANAGLATVSSVGGGGRIAVRQCAANDLSGFTGELRAATPVAVGENANAHSVGSIYVENAGDAPERGELVVDGFGRASAREGMACRLDAAIVDAQEPFGKVTVKRGGRLEIPADVTLKVVDGIGVSSDSDLHTVAGGGAIEMMPGEDGVFAFDGLVRAYGLYCTNSPGATISFADGSEMRNLANGTIALLGAEGKPLNLFPEETAATWTLNIVGPDLSNAGIEYVVVSNSTASGVMPIAYGSAAGDAGGNYNWAFLDDDIPEGSCFVWTGGNDTRWDVPGNWDRKFIPGSGDFIRIPGGLSNYPVISGSDLHVNSISNEAGASITLNGVDLFVSNALYSVGTIVDGGNRIVAFGDGDTILDFASGTAKEVYVEKTGGSVTLPSGFAADKFYCVTTDALRFAFGAGEEFEFAQCNIESRGSEPHVLGSTVPGEEWLISLTANQRVRNVTVSDSDASGGTEVKVSAAVATDAGNNTNWNFGGSIVEWIAGSGNWSTAENWSTGEVPGENDDVFIAPASGTVTVTVGAAVSMRSLTLGGTDAEAAISSAYPVSMSGDFILYKGATATLSSKNTANAVGGNVWMKSGSKLTHAANARTFARRLYMTVGGSMTIDAGASIYVTACGFEGGYGPVDNTKNSSTLNNGGSHGSAMSWNGAFMPCNDSIFEPVLPGSGGNRQGAGAVYLDVVGDLTVNGTIDARSHRPTTGDHSNYSPGAGGSICLKVGMLKGTGLLTAATATRMNVNGARKAGAGRIAVYQRTGADWSPSASLTITTQNNDNDNTHGGTIYKELPGDGYHGGTIYIQGRQYELPNYGVGYCQFPMMADGDPRRAYKNATLVISDLAYIHFVTNESFTGESATLKVKDLVFTSSAPIVRFYNAKILVMTLTHKDGAGWTGGDYDARKTNGKFTYLGTRGGIEWYRGGFNVRVR